MSDEPLEVRPIFPAAATRPYASHVVLPGAFSARQCERVVECGEANGADDARLAADEPLNDSLRRARVAWIAPEPDTAWLFDKLGGLARRVNRTYGFDLTGFGEDLQYTVYDEPGAFYTWHQDGLASEVSSRKLALVVQLSDPDSYEGCDLELFDTVADLTADEQAEAAAERRGLGTVVAFPAFEYHRVTPLQAGVRRSLVVWISGPPFR